MTWLDQLQRASFRGVPFQVDTIDHSAGDNVVMREYPFQDLPTVFRMGEAAEEIKLSAYVIGDDYHEQRDALRQVLTGQGELVHPTAGILRVFVAGKYTIKEAPTAEGGMARFDLTFIRAESRRYPAGVVNTAATVQTAAIAAKAAAIDAFEAEWTLAGQPGWVSDRAVARLKDAVTTAWAPIAKATQGLGEFTDDAIAAYQTLRDNFDSLVGSPSGLAGSISALFSLPSDFSNGAAREFQRAFGWVFDLSSRLVQRDFEVISMPAVGAGLVMYGTGNADVLGVDSATRAQLARMTAVSDQLVETLATAAWAQATTAVELAGYDEALAMRSTVHAQLVRLMQRASSAAAATSLPASSYHDALMSLHTAALADLQARSRDLVRLTTFTPEAWMPVWAISYRLFGTAEYADEILAMNPHITHPLLVPPGKALRVAKH